MESTLIQIGTEVALRLAVALGILLLGRFLAGRARAAVVRLLQRKSATDSIIPSVRMLIIRGTYYGVIVLAAAIALIVLGVSYQAILIVAGAVLVILGVALQQSLTNFAAMVIFLVFQPFKRGEDIETMNVRGIVEEIQLFNTIIQMFDHRVASLPNSKIQEFGVINFSRNGINRADVDVLIAYGEDLRRVHDLISDMLTGDARIKPDPAPQVVVLELGTDGIHVQARGTVAYPDLWPVLCDLRERIPARLQAEGIKLAVPPAREVRVLAESAIPDSAARRVDAQASSAAEDRHGAIHS
jgi:small conductance mechanosensitive channel